MSPKIYIPFIIYSCFHKIYDLYIVPIIFFNFKLHFLFTLGIVPCPHMNIHQVIHRQFLNLMATKIFTKYISKQSKMTTHVIYSGFQLSVFKSTPLNNNNYTIQWTKAEPQSNARLLEVVSEQCISTFFTIRRE